MDNSTHELYNISNHIAIVKGKARRTMVLVLTWESFLPGISNKYLGLFEKHYPDQ